ncbi:hypothetical protein FRC07_004511 [Ceratobasidium sp. 392]|nr:hypothetical protein FRC07_004511 [Ceratobasidium sp. 392]
MAPPPATTIRPLALNAPNSCPGSPPFRAPSPVQLYEGSGRGSSNQLAPMDMDRALPAPSSLLLVHPQPQGPNANATQLQPPPSLAGAAGSLFADSDRRTRSPSPHGPPPASRTRRIPARTTSRRPKATTATLAVTPPGSVKWLVVIAIVKRGTTSLIEKAKAADRRSRAQRSALRSKFLTNKAHPIESILAVARRYL